MIEDKRPARYPACLDCGYTNPLPITCPCCDGDMLIVGPNKLGTLMFVYCQGICKCCYTIALAKPEDK
jgi:hypothetical protein